MHNYRRFILFILLLSILSGCTGTPALQIPASIADGGINSGLEFISAPENAAPTPTPFKPLPPTAVYVPVSTEVPLSDVPPTAAPESIFSYGESEPQPILSQPPGQINILLLGADARPGNKKFRTDTIILVTLNPRLGTVNMLSFPRDLYIHIPGVGMNRINTAYFYGKVPLVMQTFKYNFGIRPDHYVIINFSSFKRIIDSLGGLNVYVSKKLQDYRAGYWVTIPKGSVHMDADTVLWYVRSRKTTNDFQRNQRQQDVLRSIFNRLISLDGIKRLPEFYDLYKNNVMTDLTLADLIPLIPLAAQVSKDQSRIKQYFVGSGKVSSWITPGGAMVLLPDKAKVKNIVKKSQNIK
ncbi:MAG: LCP family protein [Chloroflexota bacterium]|nr:LCP family protein [Chloroflexota bacterium]